VISLVIGRREQGKTTLAYWLARQRSTRVIFDPRAMFHTTSDVLPSGFALFELLDDREEVIVQPQENVVAAFDETTTAIRDWILQNPDEPFALLVDEARFVETTEKISPSFDWILRLGPRKTLDTILTAHRPVDISTDIRAIADYWFIFQTTQEHDLKVITERCGGEVADMVSTLEPFQLVVWNDSIGKFRKETDSEKWRVRLDLPALTTRQQAQEVHW
jgi:hypothetical protein